MKSSRLRPAELGSGSVLAIAVIGAVVATSVASMAALGALVARQGAVNAADAAALAGADVASGFAAGEVCPTAERAAAANGGSLESCVVNGMEVTVTVVRSWPTGAIVVRSRAGPPP